MSGPPSRRAILVGVGGVTAGLAGCLGFDSSEQIDVTVSNASETALDYEVSIKDFEASGSVGPSGSDQYEDKLSQPGSTTQFDVVAQFGADTSGANEGASDTSRDLELGTTNSTVDVDSNVIEISVTYSPEQIIVNRVVEN